MRYLIAILLVFSCSLCYGYVDYSLDKTIEKMERKWEERDRHQEVLDAQREQADAERDAWKYRKNSYDRELGSVN